MQDKINLQLNQKRVINAPSHLFGEAMILTDYKVEFELPN